MNLVSGRSSSAALALALFLVATLALAGRAGAAEALYWNNYSATPSTIGFAGISGGGGSGTLNLSGADGFDFPEGMAYDSVTNRLFVADDSAGDGQIVAVNLDGGAGRFTAPGAPVEGPEGLTLDPVTRTVYWINTTSDTISWARLDGSAGGLLNLSGGPGADGFRLAIDSVGGRVYWGEQLPGEAGRIAFANTDNSGGGVLNITGATPPEFVTGIAVDEVGRRVYWLDHTQNEISFASLAGGGGGDLGAPGTVEGYGLNFDPGLGRALWGVYVSGEETKADQFGYALVSGGGGSISVSAPTYGVQDPIVLKSPTGTGAPTLTRDAKARASLSCSQGSWAGDFPGGFVYQAPRTFAYQWTRNGAAVPGATAATFTATAPGSYACAVTATNHTGSAAQGSTAVNVKASKLKLKTRKKAKADPGDRVTFRVKVVNQGDIRSKKARVCVKLPKAAKDDLRKPKCKKLAPLGGLAKRTLKVRVKVKPGADQGVDKLTFQVKGTAGKAAKSKIIVR
jgi:uncharacterized repeat protein (TIGR01451 family)